MKRPNMLQRLSQIGLIAILLVSLTGCASYVFNPAAVPSSVPKKATRQQERVQIVVNYISIAISEFATPDEPKDAWRILDIVQLPGQTKVSLIGAYVKDNVLYASSFRAEGPGLTYEAVPFAWPVTAVWKTAPSEAPPAAEFGPGA